MTTAIVGRSKPQQQQLAQHEKLSSSKPSQSSDGKLSTGKPHDTTKNHHDTNNASANPEKPEKPELSSTSANASKPAEDECFTPKSPRPKTSLRRAAAASERLLSPPSETNLCTAYSTAETYDLSHCASLLRSAGYSLDPTNTGLTKQVIHLRPGSEAGGSEAEAEADVFIFPSGAIVSWSYPSSGISKLALLLRPAAGGEAVPTKGVETEDLEYTRDPRVRKSRVAGDIIILGTAPAMDGPNWIPNQQPIPNNEASNTNLTLAKIAFSSGLARSTKLAMLERLLDEYLETTSTIPTLLSKGSRLPFTRGFILKKTGELLQFRAQLNLYSELTDSLPDLFWDSRHELGLEGYYEAVGRALDVGVRIRILNEKLTYASGIVEVLRERLSERHSLGLEWMIIVLIAVEVGFELMRMWREHKWENSDEGRYKRWKEMKEREEDGEWQEWKQRNEEGSEVKMGET
ncbi:YagE family protein [Pyronema domesticum]|nr:YagE family protein [Pyronema domesticum]